MRKNQNGTCMERKSKKNRKRTEKRRIYVSLAEKDKNNQIKEKSEKTSHLVEIVLDAMISCLRLSELQARPCNQPQVNPYCTMYLQVFPKSLGAAVCCVGQERSNRSTRHRWIRLRLPPSPSAQTRTPL